MDLNQKIINCRRCPRLVAYREAVASEKRRAFLSEKYWGRPVPNFGDPNARIVFLGLAPAAHGGNRTGRIFTGDRSGDWLFRAMFKAGLSNQLQSSHSTDGLKLKNAFVTAIAHCAPPQNKPTPDEILNCQQWLDETLDSVKAQVFVALGQIAWTQFLKLAKRRSWHSGGIPKFSHGAQVQVGARWLLGSYHPSQQNTFTGKLTEEMLDRIMQTAKNLSGL